MSRPTPARIAKRKRQAEERRERRRKRLVTTGWPDLPCPLPPAIPQLRIDVTYADPPRVYRPPNRPTSTGP